jgi:transcriptional regulator with XRE-family HTH domain
VDLEQLRTKKNLTIEQLSVLSRVPSGAIRRMERNGMRLSIKQLKALSVILGVSLKDLV